MKKFMRSIFLVIIIISFLVVKTVSANELIVYNHTNGPVRVGINDPNPNTGKLLPSQQDTHISVPSTDYFVTVCFAGQTRSNPCICKRETCGRSPVNVTAKGTYSNDCSQAVLQLDCGK